MSAGVKMVFKYVVPLALEEIKKIQEAEKTFQDLESSLQDAEKLLQPIDLSQHNAILQDRVKKLQIFCYEVEDFMDDMYRRRKKRDPSNLHGDSTGHAVRCIKNCWMPHQACNMLKDLKHKMREVEKNQTPITDCGTTVPPDNINFSFKYRFDMNISSKDESAIIGKLTSKDSKGVSIVGIRGLGKRAFARYILNEEEVKDRFPLIVKASFSGSPFDISKLQPECLHNSAVEQLIDENNVLLNQRWLLWIDDLSDMPLDEWNLFRQSHLTNANDRKVLFSTVNRDVAITTETFVYYMDDLPDSDCHDLIRSCIKAKGLRSESFEYHSISAVAQKCYGLPLVAELLGLVLCKYKMVPQRIIEEDHLWHLEDFKRTLFPYLASNFKRLSKERLKFFYYLSLFPQVHKFNEDELKMLCVGAGLVRAQRTQAHNACMLEEALEWFKELWNYSIFRQKSTKDSTYQMNKFAHSFAQFTAPKIYVQLDKNSRSDVLDDINICHLSLTRDISSKDTWRKIKTRKYLRTFLSVYDGSCGLLTNIPADLFSRLISLRVLVLKNTKIEKLPNTIKKLKCLCFLDVSETNINSVRDLTACFTLQILKFKRQDGKVPFLPKNFSEFTNLVIVDWEVNGLRKLGKTPKNIGKLINLKTLPLFVVENDKGHHIKQLQLMNSLRNSLCISNLEKVKSKEDALNANISDKASLQRLELEWTPRQQRRQQQVDSSFDVLSGLKPHVKLSELKIEYYGGVSFPTWISQPSFGLRKVHLKNCRNCKRLPSFGQLQALEEIYIEEMPSLTSIDGLFSGTSENSTSGCSRTLKSIVLSDMEALEDWRELGVAYMTKLNELKIERCKSLGSFPSLTYLTSLVAIEIQACGALPNLPKLPSSLKSLIIDDSKQLREWCNKSQDEYWAMERHNKLRVTLDGKPFPLPRMV